MVKPNVGKDEEKPDHIHTAGENGKWYSYPWKDMSFTNKQN